MINIQMIIPYFRQTEKEKKKIKREYYYIFSSYQSLDFIKIISDFFYYIATFCILRKMNENIFICGGIYLSPHQVRIG